MLPKLIELRQSWRYYRLNPLGQVSSIRRGRALSIILILLILATIGTLIYVIAAPKVGERFTEFYILGPEGRAENYPSNVVLGEEVRVILGIVNRESEELSYRVVVNIDEVKSNEIGPVVLANDEKWEQEVSFIPTRVGENQKVAFVLYKQGQEEPYRTLRLWIDVKGR